MGAGNIVAEYIWIDGYGNLRSKARTLSRDSDSPPWNDISYIPEWNYDGSSTYQATGDNSEVLIRDVNQKNIQTDKSFFNLDLF